MPEFDEVYAISEDRLIQILRNNVLTERRFHEILAEAGRRSRKNSTRGSNVVSLVGLLTISYFIAKTTLSLIDASDKKLVESARKAVTERANKERIERENNEQTP